MVAKSGDTLLNHEDAVTSIRNILLPSSVKLSGGGDSQLSSRQHKPRLADYNQDYELQFEVCV